MSKKYLTVYNLSREKDWILKNAFDIIETQEINTVWQLEFSIPMNDQDQQHCQPYWYVRYGDDGQLYRFTEQVKTNADTSTVTYHCEHVIATLSDDIMFQGPHMIGNIGTYTNQVLTFILNKQTVKNWTLGTCEPRRQFEYSWENENLLAALFSVPNCFATPYMWTYDTTSFPWKVNLVEIHEDADPDFYLMAKKNILRSSESSTNLEICTRLYGLGEGEGVNQLTIKSVNNGLPYIQSSPEKIAEYGIVSRIFVDRRYQYPEMLKARMETLLHELETPSMKREFDIVDLYDKSPDDMYKAEVGRICLLKDDNTKVYITKTVKNWTVPGDMKITIATKATDISTSIADLADRQRIEQVYSQGASQVYSFNFSGNATDQYPLNGYVYFPEDLKYLNEVKLKVMIDPFRSYSKASSGNSGGITNQETENNGAVKNKSTEDGGAVTDKDTETGGAVKNKDTENGGAVKNKDTENGGQVTDKDTENGGAVKNKDTEDGGAVKNKDTEDGGAVKNKDTEDGGAVKNKDTEDGGAVKNKDTEDGGAVKDKDTEDGGAVKDKDTEDGGEVKNKDTEDGGAVNTETGEGGGETGETGISSGGSGISLNDLTLNITVNDTDDAVWDRVPYTENTDLDIKVTGSGAHQHSVQGRTANTEPLESVDYRHSHRFDESGINLAYTGYGEGSHSHEAYVDNGEDTGHHHNIPRWTLKHHHGVTANGSVSINNTEGEGLSGFQHSHNFKIKAHTHPISLDAHSHKFSLDAHSHKFSLDAHSHKFSLDAHNHKFSLDPHNHKFSLDAHNHKFSLDAHSHKFSLDAHSHKFSLDAHNHKFSLDPHNHKFSLDAHNHKFSLDAHSHKFSLDAHNHKFSLDPHSHDIEPGIFESGKPTQAKVYIDNVYKFSVTDTNSEVDITDYLKKNGKVPRGQWIQISIQPSNAAPNNMAFISAFGNVFAFIQSYTGGNY